MLDKEIVMQVVRQSCTAVKEVLNKKPIDTADNIVSFLNGLTQDDLKEASIKDINSFITWERKVVCKHQHIDIVQVKIDIMNHQVKLFIDLFTTLLKKGLPFFQKYKDRMLSQT